MIAGAGVTPAQLATVFTNETYDAPRPNPYDMGWDGLHCPFLYTPDTLLDFPAVPVFEQGGNRDPLSDRGPAALRQKL